MKSNVVLIDRSLRMALGMLLLATPLLELHTYPYNLLGLVLVATAGFGYCPLYALLGALKPASVAARQEPVHGISRP
jgi:hypothetical protein